MKPRQYIILSCLLGVLCLLGGGCATNDAFSFDPLSGWEHHEDVKSYEDRGVSHQNAERAASEDEFFEQMHEISGDHQ
jgi:hypothetical protein